MNDRVRILVLDGHTNQALACVRSLGRAGYEVIAASDRRLPLSAWSRYCKDYIHLDGENIGSFAALRERARTSGVSLVLPVTERSCLLLNAERREWEAAGMTIGCGPEEMLTGAFDKAQILGLTDECGLSAPETRLPASLQECREAADEVGYPCVVKPRWSNAWTGNTFLVARGPRYVDSPGQLEEAVLASKQGECWPLIQGYVKGAGKGVFALCDRGRAIAWFAHERLRDVRPTGSGSSLRRSIRVEPRLRKPAERLLARLKWHGPAMVEFRDDGVSAPYLIEINGRFWGSLQLAVEAGVDFPRLWVSTLMGKSVKDQGEYVEGVTLRWLWGDAKRLLYILKGRPRGYPYPYPSVWQGIKELFGPQPVGTHLEIWQTSDPLPAVGEWVEGIRGLLGRG
ncbi:MAG TPA: ATP-grasp domain-containing protein [Blastocatellia bacterium]|nr:ATP-grasp domain-containing protein [Blastocatellia bacterium]